ncbi:phage major capsid protein [Nitrospirillum amazonense]|uniref:phage major capsid protein n=1 Tax=Nitrospirillum amazonense TaxID=28077 RepID=UPI002DD42A35|nr:phage major capsid protein [Nitrospirillum amazonense]MEC4590558.1 phage major capsid protein [Nitrospirillum amazonense]
MANPVADQIEAEAQALAQRLADVAQAVVADALKDGAIISVADVVNALQGLTDTLPPALVSAIADALPDIADRAINAAQAEIADARDASGSPFPPVVAPKAADYNYGSWAATAAGALVGALVAAANSAAQPQDGQPAPAVADALKAALSAVDRAAASAGTHTGPLADTAAARGFNDAREAVFNSNDDIVSKLKFVAIEDGKTSEICRHMDGAEFSLRSSNIARPPLHPGCRSHLAAVMGVKRRAGATAKERDRQDWAIFRRLQRKAAADQAQAEGRAVEWLEVRFAPADGDTAGTFRGIASAYGVLDAHGTEFRAGAFAASLAERRSTGQRIPILLHHDPARVAGVVTNVNDTPHGLEIEGRFLTDTADGRDGYALAKSGGMSLSVGFKRLADQPRPGGGRTITSARLAEVSLVSIASNPRARILEVRETNAGPETAPDCHHHHHDKEAAMADESTAATGGQNTETRADPGATVAAVDALTKRLDKLEARAARQGLGGGDGTTDATGDLERRAFSRYLRTGTPGMSADETRAMRLSDDESAGYLAPADFVAEIDKDLTLFSPIRALATVRTTGRSEVNTLRRTSPASATWVGEDDDRPETEVKYGQQTFNVRELGTYVDVSLSLLEDSAVDVAAELASEFAEAFGVTESQSFVNGDGALKPMGFMSDPNLSYTPGGDAAAVKADGLIDLFHALKPAYRQNGVWLMNSTTLAAVRKLKDSQGRYLVDIGGLANAPSTLLLGRPVVEAVDMPDIAGNAFPIAFGDFGIGYRIYDRVALSIVRDDFTQRTKGRVRFHGRRRVAAGVRRPEAIRKLRISVS